MTPEFRIYLFRNEFYNLMKGLLSFKKEESTQTQVEHESNGGENPISIAQIIRRESQTHDLWQN